MSNIFISEDFSSLPLGTVAAPWLPNQILNTTSIVGRSVGPTSSASAEYSLYRAAYDDNGNYKVDNISGTFINPTDASFGHIYKITAYIYFNDPGVFIPAYANREIMIWKALLPAQEGVAAAVGLKLSTYRIGTPNIARIFINGCVNFNEGSDGSDKDITDLFVAGQANKLEILFNYNSNPSPLTAKAFINDIFIDDMDVAALVYSSSPFYALRLDHSPAVNTRTHVLATKSIQYESVDLPIESVSFTESGSLALTDPTEDSTTLEENKPSSQLAQRGKFQSSNFNSRRPS